VNIAIMRAFVKLREMRVAHKYPAHEVEARERKYQEHDKDL